MADKTEIINIARSWLGQPDTLVGADDPNPQIQALVRRYPGIVKKEFEAQGWIFASEIVQLEQLAGTQIYWEYAYNLPADFVRLVLLNSTGNWSEPPARYEARAAKVYTNLSCAILRYVSSKYLTQEGAWPQKFAEGVGARLASTLSPKINRGENVVIDLNKLADDLMAQAKSADSMLMPARQNPMGRWNLARRQRSAENG